jgi:hypothetical protein
VTPVRVLVNQSWNDYAFSAPQPRSVNISDRGVR